MACVEKNDLFLTIKWYSLYIANIYKVDLNGRLWDD